MKDHNKEIDNIRVGDVLRYFAEQYEANKFSNSFANARRTGIIQACDLYLAKNPEPVPLADAVPVKEPKAPAGLVEELRKFAEQYGGIPKREILSILFRYEAEEPLEELGKRKGFDVEVDVQVLDKDLLAEANFEDSSKARAYLKGLPDVGKGGE